MIHKNTWDGKETRNKWENETEAVDTECGKLVDIYEIGLGEILEFTTTICDSIEQP